VSLPGAIDFGERQPKGGGTVLLVAGLLVLVAGILGAAYGIGQAIGQAGAITDDAVARGFVRPGFGQAIAFETPRPKLTVYLDFDGITSNSVVYDDASGATSCEVTARDGSVRTFTGARQGTAATIGDLVSVGSFEVPSPSGRIRCGYTRSGGGLPSEVPFLLTPHSTGEVVVPVLIIIGCVFAAIGGGWAAFVGRSRRRKRARI
jgi:hypothetical protein